MPSGEFREGIEVALFFDKSRHPMDDKLINTSVTFKYPGTQIRFSFQPEEEEGEMEFFVERRDRYEGNEEDEINYVLATFSLDEAEYIARRMLDAVVLQRKQEAQEEIPDLPKEAPLEECIPTPEEKERLELLSALEKFNWNREKAAQELGITLRTLYRKMKQHGLV